MFGWEPMAMSDTDEEIRKLLREIKELQREHLDAYKEFTTWVREDTKKTREEYGRATEAAQLHRQQFEVTEKARERRALMILVAAVLILFSICLWSYLF